MSSTLIICITIVTSMAILGLTGIGILGVILRYKSKESREARAWATEMFDKLIELYANLLECLHQMCE